MTIPAVTQSPDGLVTPGEDRATSRQLAHAEPAMSWRRLAAVPIFVGLMSLPASAAAEGCPPVDITFQKYALPNGLEVILHEHHDLPLVAVNVWYHVGPVNEPRGRSGFAHLFEHLMFEGSRHVGNRIDELLESVGATNCDGTTSWDRTNYFETVPREHLELALWIESDRMGFLSEAFTPARFRVQRKIVKNERRQTYENAPYGPSELALYHALFPEHHPYRGAVIGSTADLDAATIADVKAFYDTYYAPSNATLTVAGDYDPTAIRPLIAKYFGTLRTRPRPPRARVNTPPLAAERRVVVDEPVKIGRIMLGWLTPPAYSRDDTALDLASLILAGGKATRLYRRLVIEEKVAVDVSASLDSAELTGIFTVTAMPASGHPPEVLERSIDAVLGELAERGPNSGELERARRRLLVDLFQTLELLNGSDDESDRAGFLQHSAHYLDEAGGESGRAGLLQRFNHYLGDPGFLPQYLERIERLSAADIQRTVQRWLRRPERVVVLTRPEMPGRRRRP